MRILGLETSCDETAASVVEDGTKILSNSLASSLPLHAQTGGVIPEVAAREQLRSIVPVLEASVKGGAKKSSRGAEKPDIDAVAVAYGPGLMGSLFVGTAAAQTLAFAWNKPLVAVNHLVGHLYASWLENSETPSFPLVALIVSGGHTELLYVSGHGRWDYLGGTRDDAAGEAFDKIARLLGLGYPGGPAIEKRALSGTTGRFDLPRPLITNPSFDFSFSGLKTATVNLVTKLNRSPNKNGQQVSDLAASVQEAIVEVLAAKTLRAAQTFRVGSIVLGGGVAANKKLREEMASRFTGRVFFSRPKYATDNAAMIAGAAYFNYKPVPWRKLRIAPSLLF